MEARAGDARTSFEHVVAEHEGEVLRICRSVLRDEHLGRDAMQETFVKLWRVGTAGPEPARRGAWLRRVALTSAIDLARRGARRERPAGEPLEDEPASAATDGSAPLEQAARAELSVALDSALADLSPRQREVFTLRHHGGLSLGEVAERLGVEITTVKTQFARACWKLQERLAHLRGDRA